MKNKGNSSWIMEIVFDRVAKVAATRMRQIEEETLRYQMGSASGRGSGAGAGLLFTKLFLDSFPAALLGCYRI
jgi:hypothetical protein